MAGFEDMFVDFEVVPVSWIPAGIYLLKVNIRNTRARSEICSGVFIVNFEHILHLVLVFLLLTLNL